MTLSEKIDEVIQIVEFIYHAIDEGEIDSGLNREEFKQFKELAESIYTDAVKSDLDRHLMKVADLKAEFTRAPSWLQFETPLNLPGWWVPFGPTYVLYPAYRWLDAMRTVARLAEGISTIDDSKWLNQTEVSGKLIINKTKIGRLIKSGVLKTNGKTGRDCRVDPVSILAYCKVEGIIWGN